LTISSQIAFTSDTPVIPFPRFPIASAHPIAFAMSYSYLLNCLAFGDRLYANKFCNSNILLRISTGLSHMSSYIRGGFQDSLIPLKRFSAPASLVTRFLTTLTIYFIIMILSLNRVQTISD